MDFGNANAAIGPAHAVRAFFVLFVFSIRMFVVVGRVFWFGTLRNWSDFLISSHLKLSLYLIILFLQTAFSSSSPRPENGLKSRTRWPKKKPRNVCETL